MKMSKEELKQKVSELVEDNDKAIELLEAIEDSMDIVEETAPDTTELDELKIKFEELQNKYKERFLKGEEVKEEEKTEEVEEYEDKEIVDVKEI